MNPFEYVSPSDPDQATALLSDRWGPAEVLAGGTDLLALMKDAVVTPGRLVNIKAIGGLSGVSFSGKSGLKVGALVTLADLAVHPLVATNYPALAEAIHDAASPQIRNRATLGGNLCQRPRCWYFRNGHGLLALDPNGGSLVTRGDNRYHAILGNDGPAFFVSPSTVAPTLIALDAEVSIAGPSGSKRTVPLGRFYVTPKAEGEREHDLRPNEIVLGVRVPPPKGAACAYYEVRQKHAFDWPVATASVTLRRSDGAGAVEDSHVILGQVAPTPWRSAEAEGVLKGKAVTPSVAREAGLAAVQGAKSLGKNGYKIRVAAVAVQRALLLAAGQDPLSE
jgi:xanthine dehydrogenase YagS FAD-binding subunit